MAALAADPTQPSQPNALDPRSPPRHPRRSRTLSFLFLATTLLLLTSVSGIVVAKPREENAGTDHRDDGDETPRMAGKITNTDGTYEGRYVSFEFDETDCTLRDYRVQRTRVFDEVKLPGACRDGAMSLEGDHVRLETTDAEFSLFDAPNGLLNFDAADEDIVFHWPEYMEPDTAGDGVQLPLGDHEATLRVHGRQVTDVSGTGASVSGSGAFWVQPVAAGTDTRERIREHIESGVIAGEVDVLLDVDTVAKQALAYDDVELSAAEQGPGHFRVVVDANLTEGRVFVVNLGPRLVAGQDIGIRYWDVEATSVAFDSKIVEADSLEDLLSIEPDEPTKYWMVTDGAGTHVLVALPHFSVHIFDVFTILKESPPSILTGVVAGCATVAFAAIGLRQRRRDH